ncbi:MAG: hypothetical protein GX279_06540 [Clostridiaceae bacterium]|jgi:hypothetical protein|nr:hypothetical protein [Clostridiaceae bacterium]
MKNKKFLTIIAVVVMSGLLLTAGAMAANPAGSAYEQFKSLLDQDHESNENATVNVSMSVTDNGKAVAALDGSMKVDKQIDKMSGIFQISGKTEKSFEIYKDNDDVLLHLAGSENWYKTAHKDEESEDEEEFGRRFGRDKREDAGENKQLREAFLDTIMGEYKNQVSMTESNGLRTFSLSFDEGNMPILLQTVFQLSDDHNEKEDAAPADLSLLPQELQDAFADLKNCEYDVELVEKKLERIEISITVDEQNELKAMGISMSCSGTDAKGADHYLDVDFSIEISEVGTTIADEADPDPAKITTIDGDALKDAGRRHWGND